MPLASQSNGTIVKARTLAVLTLGSLALSSAQAQFSFCSQPYPPSAYLSKPTKPFCASSGRGCSETEIMLYRNEVRGYFDRLKRYAREVDQYFEDASTYIKCMSELG